MDLEDALRLLSKDGMDFLSVHDSYGRYLFASENAPRFFGWAPDDLMGQAAYDFFHPEDLEAIGQSHSKSLYDDHENVVQYRLRRKDGRYMWVETSSRTIKRDGNDRGTILTVTRDIRHRAPKAANTF